MTQTVRAAVLAAMGKQPTACGVLFFVFDGTTDQATLSDEEIARAQAVMLLGDDDPGITCAYWGPTWVTPAGGVVPDLGACVSATGGGTCNPCDDGAGGTLQNVGETCAGDDATPAPPGGPSCCHGLTCEGAMASTMGACTGMLQCPQGQPNWQPLDTGTLRNICTNSVNGAASQSGIALNRTCGLAFERWVLTTMGQGDRWTKPIPSPERKAANNNGLPASVIPEFVGPLSQWWVMPAGATDFAESTFFEVKAVNGTLTPNSNQSQILALLNVAQISQAGVSVQLVPSPALVFTTTSNTTLSSAVGAQATARNVGVWQQIVEYDANGGSNPNLRIMVPQMPFNPAPYSTPVKLRNGFDPWAHSPLTSPTAPLSTFQVPGDPDPDSATVVE
jgi:hypothetical protein